MRRYYYIYTDSLGCRQHESYVDFASFMREMEHVPDEHLSGYNVLKPSRSFKNGIVEWKSIN